MDADRRPFWAGFSVAFLSAPVYTIRIDASREPSDETKRVPKLCWSKAIKTQVVRTKRESFLESCPRNQVKMIGLRNVSVSSFFFGSSAHCLELLKHFQSLESMAIEVRKPMLVLNPADGTIDSHVRAVQGC